MADEFKRLDRELVYKGSIVDFYKDTVKVPNGNVVKWDFIKHQGAACLLYTSPKRGITEEPLRPSLLPPLRFFFVLCLCSCM